MCPHILGQLYSRSSILTNLAQSRGHPQLRPWRLEPAQILRGLLHQWLEATDGTGAAVRVILFYYQKAFDLIDHGILVQKILTLSIPRGVAQWVINFLTSRKQRLLLSCYSHWQLMPAVVPQGTKLGPGVIFTHD